MYNICMYNYYSGISGMSLSNFPSDTRNNYKVNFQIYFEPFFYVL